MARKKSDRKALGRGLSALLGEAGADVATAAVAGPHATWNDQPGDVKGNTGPTQVPIDLIRANPNQPRQTFRQEDLEDLANSLRRHGVIQPVILRPDPSGGRTYEIVAGERRWRAAQIAGVHQLPALIRELDDKQILELAIIENVQRVDLDPVEEALGYTQLVETFGYTQEELSEVIGKSRSHLANTMRLLALPEPVLAHVRKGELSAGHARALITAEQPLALARKAISEGLTVRQIEALAKKGPVDQGVSGAKPKPEKDADTRMLEGDLSAAIGMRARIEHGAEGGGELRIRYKSLDQLDELCRKLTE